MKTIIGFSGALIILIAFFLNQRGAWSRTSLRYDIANALGSLLLVWYAILVSSYPFLILNSVWVVISLRDILKKIL